MKKWNNLRIGALLLAVACLIGTSACSSAQAGTSSSASSEESSTQAAEAVSHTGTDDQNTIYGKVTAVDGDKITLAVGTLNGKGRMGGGQSMGGNGTESGSASGGSGNRQGPGGGQPGGGNGSKPEGSASGAGNASMPDRQGGSDDLLTLTGETKTITISDESILSKQQMGGRRGPQGASSGDVQESSSVSQETESAATASLSEIQEGTILKVTYQSDGETLSSVVILGGNANN